MQELFNYKNVFYDSKSDYNIDQINEREYCRSIFTHLKSQLQDNFRHFQFFILFSHDPAVIPESCHVAHNKKVLLWFSEESGEFPIHLSKYYALIFKSYIQTESLNIYTNPLGYVNEFEKYSKGNKIKCNNLFFSGNLNKYRIEIYELFAYRKYRFLRMFRMKFGSLAKLLFFRMKIRNLSIQQEKTFIFFSNGFKSGLAYPEYVKQLGNSRFVLCPKGFQSNETFRHIEALHFGCIVISGVMPDVSIYNNHPFITYKNVQELDIVLNNIKTHKYDEKDLVTRHIAFYKQKLSIESASSYISNNCRNCINKNLNTHK